MISRRSFATLMGLACLYRGASNAYADTYPNRVIKIVVPFPAGGPTDLVGRLASRALSLQFGQNIIVENIPGAGGTIGSELVAHANPDDYTLLIGGTNSNLTPYFFKDLKYDPIKDFAPVASIAIDSSALVVIPSVPAKTVSEFIQYVKDNSGKVTTAAVFGIAPHIMVRSFVARIGGKTVFVPYKGGAPEIRDMLGGQVQMTFGAKSAFLPYIQAGKLRVLAVTSDRRWPELPDVPTMAESGFADFPGYQWYTLLAPVGTSGALIGRLNSAFAAGMKSPNVVAGFAKLGIETKLESPQNLATILTTDAKHWEEMVKSADLKMD